MKVRKKLVVVEAHQWTGKERSVHDVPEWLAAAILGRDALPKTDGSILVVTPTGTVRAQPGDYIIQGIEGELYPCKPSIFDKTYEIVEEDKYDEG